MKKNAIYFYIAVFGIFLGICGPKLFSDGMFMDGLLYAVVSKNLANGLGTFWYPHCTDILFPSFHEHPPLVFGLQSIWFSVFGSSIYVERFYCLTTFIIASLLIILIWKKITGELFNGWIPLLFWISIPLVSWGYANNMIENTMTIFVCASALFYLMSIEKRRVLFILIGGLSLFLGLLTKGFVSLFIWSFPFWIWVLLKKVSLRRMIVDSILLVGFTVLPLILLLMFSSQAFDSLQKYFFNKVVDSILNVVSVKTRFYVVYRLALESLVNIAIVMILVIIGIRRKWGNNYFLQDKRASITFFLLGLSGVLPIMCTMKQSAFYMLSAFPFFAIGFGLLIRSGINKLLSNIIYYSRGFKIFKIISYCMLAISVIISVSRINHIGRARDKAKIEMIYNFIKIIPGNTTIGIHPKLWTDWSLHGYFGRYANISLDPEVRHPYEFYLVKNDFSNGTEEKKLEKIKDYNGYSLFKKR